MLVKDLKEMLAQLEKYDDDDVVEVEYEADEVGYELCLKIKDEIVLDKCGE